MQGSEDHCLLLHSLQNLGAFPKNSNHYLSFQSSRCFLICFLLRPSVQEELEKRPPNGSISSPSLERNEWPRGKVKRRKLETPGGRASPWHIECGVAASFAASSGFFNSEEPREADLCWSPLTLLGSNVLEQQEQQQKQPRPAGGVAARREGTAAYAGQRGPASGGGRGLASETLRTVRGFQRSPARHRGGRQSARIVRAPPSPARPGPAAPGENAAAAQRASTPLPGFPRPLPAARVASSRFPSREPQPERGGPEGRTVVELGRAPAALVAGPASGQASPTRPPARPPSRACRPRLLGPPEPMSGQFWSSSSRTAQLARSLFRRPVSSSPEAPPPLILLGQSPQISESVPPASLDPGPPPSRGRERSPPRWRAWSFWDHCPK